MSESSPWVRAAIDHVEALCDGAPLDRSVPITMHFHPDRGHNGVSVISRLAQERLYRSQFETGTSNGGLTAHPGGSRWLWEQRMFGGAYDDAPPSERPKYGALNHRLRSVGGALRFGSSHLRLVEQMHDRATYCFPDSAFEPEHFGVAQRFALTSLAEAFDQVGRDDAMEASEGGLLDDYIEAHVHGPIDLSTDVDALVLDPCYRGTGVHESALRTGVPIEWHEGRVLSIDELTRHPDFRGPEPITLGLTLARDGRLNAQLVGDAANLGTHDPQTLKRLWHLIARFGKPATGASTQD